MRIFNKVRLAYFEDFERDLEISKARNITWMVAKNFGADRWTPEFCQIEGCQPEEIVSTNSSHVYSFHDKVKITVEPAKNRQFPESIDSKYLYYPQTDVMFSYGKQFAEFIDPFLDKILSHVAAHCPEYQRDGYFVQDIVDGKEG